MHTPMALTMPAHTIHFRHKKADVITAKFPAAWKRKLVLRKRKPVFRILDFGCLVLF